MFPTVSHLFQYLFGVRVALPVQTFGCFLALAFVGAYYVFRSEFKRMEMAGRIHPFKKEKKNNSLFQELVLYGILGFAIGYKLGGALFYRAAFASAPADFIFSLRGSLAGGMVVSALLILWTYKDYSRGKRNHGSVTNKVVLVHPWQLMDKITFWAGFWGFIGAKVFSCLENPRLFLADPFSQLLSLSGLTFYGGLTFGAISFLYIGRRHGMKLIDLADIGSPGMMLAYGIGRIGCHLSGDGDWGVENHHSKLVDWLPDWAWSFKFPHNILEQGVPLQGCTGNYCNELINGVYPTSFYEAAICITLFAAFWLNRGSIKIPGLTFSLYLLLNGGERFFIEMIRVSEKYHIGGWGISQGQLIAVLMAIAGIGGLSVIVFNNKSPNPGTFIGKRLFRYKPFPEPPVQRILNSISFKIRKHS